MRAPSFAARRARAGARRFARDERGGLTVETVLIMPVLFWALAASFVMWDAFRAHTAALKASYTIADAISREMVPIDAAYIGGLERLFGLLTGAVDPAAIRVSVVARRTDAATGAQADALVWSATTGAAPPLAALADIAPHVPVMGPGDEVIVVETFAGWRPAFDIGLPAREIANVTVSRPRFIPRVCWIACPLDTTTPGGPGTTEGS